MSWWYIFYTHTHTHTNANGKWFWNFGLNICEYPGPYLQLIMSIYGENMSHSLEENNTNNKMIHSRTDSSIQLGKSEKVWGEKAGRKDRQSACEKEDFRGVSTNLQQVFAKLHQSAPSLYQATPIYTKSWQSYTSLQQSALIYTKSPSNCSTSSPTGSDAHIRVCSCRTIVVAMKP